MEITTRTVGRCKILDLSGELISGLATEALRKAVLDAVQEDTYKVVLNLKNMSFMDSVGFGELVISYNYVQNHGGKLVLLNVSWKYKKLIELTKTLTTFEFFDDEQKALEGCE